MKQTTTRETGGLAVCPPCPSSAREPALVSAREFSQAFVLPLTGGTPDASIDITRGYE
ncbi:MAG: hypothetical protein JRJ00_12430 [Deltaproteobacteria bacterium]|nr:hypothetical protein [Deltaproteobacteria bacterium]